MAEINIYLNFNGNCEDAFNLYKTIFGGEFNHFSRFGEMPESEDYKVPELDKNKVMHVSFPIGNSVIMGSDVGGDWAPSYTLGNNFSVSITPKSKEEADTIFGALSKGGKVTTPLHNTFWGAYFGMVTDQFGVIWMINLQAQN